LKSHYYHEVARFVAVFKRDMTKVDKYVEIDLERFLARSYDETFTRENAKRLKFCNIRLPSMEQEPIFGAKPAAS